MRLHTTHYEDDAITEARDAQDALNDLESEVTVRVLCDCGEEHFVTKDLPETPDVDRLEAIIDRLDALISDKDEEIKTLEKQVED